MVLDRGSDPRADIFVIFGIEFSIFGRNRRSLNKGNLTPSGAVSVLQC